jgi:cytochrome P450/NADPH-cytochrome P450 reductase
MGFRFNNFYSVTEHEFVQATAEFLTESGRRSQRLPLPDMFYRKENAGYEKSIQVLRSTAEAVPKGRVANPENSRTDLVTGSRYAEREGLADGGEDERFVHRRQLDYVSHCWT